ncbi:hypothetical protein DFH09DRAFT_1111835 [Mycena vulgaris]|nr:hypothetical protein DFH09DRAFT_1111835 [Mycena vulgaris]
MYCIDPWIEPRRTQLRLTARSHYTFAEKRDTIVEFFYKPITLMPVLLPILLAYLPMTQDVLDEGRDKTRISSVSMNPESLARKCKKELPQIVEGSTPTHNELWGIEG